MWLASIDLVFKEYEQLTAKHRIILKAKYLHEDRMLTNQDTVARIGQKGYGLTSIETAIREICQILPVENNSGETNLHNWLLREYEKNKLKLSAFQIADNLTSEERELREYIGCGAQIASSPTPNPPKQRLFEPEQLLDMPMSEDRDELSGEFQQEVAARQKIENPITAMKLEQPGGLVSLGSPFYIACDKEFQMSLETIANPNGLVRIKSPRQMGKTSLLERILNDFNCKEWRTVKINLKATDSQSFQDTNQYLKWFFQQIISQLKLPIKLSQAWDDSGATNINCSDFFEDYLLKSTEPPLVLAIDNLDIIFDYRDIANDFLGYLRTWIEDTSRSWSSLKIAIVHTWHYETEKVNRSPLNIGTEINLPDLTVTQIQNLVCLHELNWNEQNILDLTNFVGGHPYLIRLALYHIANDDTTLSSLLTDAHIGHSIYSKYLQRQEKYITSDQKLTDLMAKVVNRDCPLEIKSIDSGSSVKLQELGLVEYRCNAIQPKNQLLKLYFIDRL